MRALYPPLANIEGRYGPTKVHLQVYDGKLFRDSDHRYEVYTCYVDTAHILPVLFSFTTPAKFCFRAIATFCKHVTGMGSGPSSPLPTGFSSPSVHSPESLQQGDVMEMSAHVKAEDIANDHQHSRSLPSSPNRSLSIEFQRALTMMRRRSSKSSTHTDHRKSPHNEGVPVLPHGGWHQVHSSGSSSNDVGGPRFPTLSSRRQPEGRTAGDPSVYDGELVRLKWFPSRI